MHKKQKSTCDAENSTLFVNGCNWSVAPPLYVHLFSIDEIIKCSRCRSTKDTCDLNVTLVDNDKKILTHYIKPFVLKSLPLNLNFNI